jgi:hypothetical protein
MKPSRERIGWISGGIILSLIIAITSFGLGYWEGQHSQLAGAVKRIGGSSGQLVNSSLPVVSRPSMAGGNVPANASPEMKEFLENRAKLSGLFNQVRSQGTNGAPNLQALAQFQEQNKALLDRQRELSQTISEQQAKNPLPTPAPLQIPPGCSPQLADYLTARDQLMRDQIAFMNQHRTDDPPTRQTAMQQWRQQNATRFQQVQQQAQALAQNNPVTTATTTK